MTKLVLPSVHRATIAFVLQTLSVMTFTTKRMDALLGGALRTVEDAYASATPQQLMKARVDIETVTGNIGHYASKGDSDLLAAYSKFSIVEFPFMPLAVGHLRAALGRYKVVDLLTPEHIKMHDRAAVLFVDIHDVEGAGIERDADILMQFIFRNFDHAEDIYAVMQERRITNPKDIADLINDHRVMPALSDGLL
jgi:hypothetical protein